MLARVLQRLHSTSSQPSPRLRHCPMVGDGCAGPPYASIWSDHAFGRIGWAWRETAVEDTDYETVINDLLKGQFANPVRVIGFNTAEG